MGDLNPVSPKKIGGKPKRREVSPTGSVGSKRSPPGIRTVYKRAVKAKRRPALLRCPKPDGRSLRRCRF